ncbi:MAG: hypothetical protein KME16_23635 [Scytolyngbya sp. HA4215-MV1]|jgi:hypothetical protein|nr:hypothetical protein [Scytolyngbya sp. HA4215-MV1]
MTQVTINPAIAQVLEFPVPSDLIKSFNLSRLTDVSSCRKTSNFKYKVFRLKNRSNFFFLDACLCADDGSNLTNYFEITTCDSVQNAMDYRKFFVDRGEFIELKPGFWVRISWLEAAWFGEVIDPASDEHVFSDDDNPRKCFERIQKFMDEYTLKSSQQQVAA